MTFEIKEDADKRIFQVKEYAKGIWKGFNQYSIFDPDYSAKHDHEDLEVITMKQFIDHLTGKQKLTNEQIKQWKRQMNYIRFL